MNRTEIYDAVWAAPMAQAAATLGVGERALAKACRKAGIPTPPRGHWRKVTAGHAGERPPLGEAPAGKGDVTMPREAASQRRPATPRQKPWPTELLHGEGPQEQPPCDSVLQQPDLSPQMIDAIVGALATEYQRAVGWRHFLTEVLARTVERDGVDTPAARMVLRLLRAHEGCRSSVDMAAQLLVRMSKPTETA